MSCDGNRHKFMARMAQHKTVQDAFGGAAEAESGLEKIFQTARAQAGGQADADNQRQAEARTRKLFDEMRALGLKPPTHSPSGLPRKDAQLGYAAIQQTLDALRSRKTLPGLARQVLAQNARPRQVSAIGQDSGGYMRCRNCGRFASRSGGHVCPATASVDSLQRHLARRIGGETLPDTAYGRGLAALLEQARQENGVTLRHGLSGETIHATLDGLPLALLGGFVPQAWQGQTQSVQTGDGRILNVLDPTGLEAWQVAPETDALQIAGAAYGLSIPESEAVGSATQTPPISYQRSDSALPAPAAPVVDGETLAQAIRAGLEGLTIQAPSASGVDGDALAQAIRSGLEGLTVQTASAPVESGEIRQAISSLAEIARQLAEQRAAPEAQLRRALQPPEPAPVSAGDSARCPQCGQFRGADHACPPRAPRQGRPVSNPEQRSAQEHILEAVTLPAPDPYLLNVPQSIGGQLCQPLDEFIPRPDPHFEINEQTEKIMRGLSAMLQMGAGKAHSAWTRAFGLYGPPGTGKNTVARQIAASLKTVDETGQVSQGLNYIEANITPESSMQELIGATVLEKDPDSGATVSRPRLGKVGLAAAMGSVICINEIVRNPKLATALQSMIEDGEIQIDSPEQGLIRIPVHPATVFVMTWNPGLEGDEDRPGQAPLSRIVPFRMDKPSVSEQARRAESFFAQLRGEKSEVDSIGARRREITARSYHIPADLTPSEAEITTAVRFFNEISAFTESGEIGARSKSPTTPGQRQLNRFLALGKSVGWEQALDTLKVICDQDAEFENQWSLVQERFRAHFGDDGQALGRAAPTQD